MFSPSLVTTPVTRHLPSGIFVSMESDKTVNTGTTSNKPRAREVSVIREIKVSNKSFML
jgi:hypothetical protein